MNSPFTGSNVTLQQEHSELIFRKEKFQYIHLCYVCEDTQERFTTTEIDEINLSQVYNQYRIKYGIPFADDIKQIRQMYELPASSMSEILGFGDNQYRLYENGNMPSEANGKILSSIKEPSIFKVFVENAKNQFDAKEYEKILFKLKRSMEIEQSNLQEQFIFDTYSRGIYNGYAAQSYSKLKNIMLYFIEKFGAVYNTKMNKLLFYTDFMFYKTYGFGMSGLAYKAIQFGPVPVRWDRVYSLMDDIYPEIVELSSGYTGTKLSSTLSPDYSCFEAEELSVLETIANRFSDISAAEISELSHQEDAWKKYYTTNQMIEYNEAFSLRAFDE